MTAKQLKKTPQKPQKTPKHEVAKKPSQKQSKGLQTDSKRGKNTQTKEANVADTTAKASNGDVNLQQFVAKMTDNAVPWYNTLASLKSLKVAQEAVQTSTKKNKHRKNTQSVQEEPAQLNQEFIEQQKKRAQKLLEDEVQRYEAKKSSKMSSDDKYLATMMKSGTLADRVAALTLTIQASPFHSLTRLGQLINMANKKARRESLMAVDSLKDLFLNNLLPDDRKLQFFHQHPLNHPDVTPDHLVMWFFEHCLKTAFAQLVGVLSSGMDDAVDNHKRACIRAANALLTAKPEQEAVLLAMLVNKLGDPDRKIAAYIHKTLQDLLREHPVMKRVVVDEVERLLTRSKVSDRAKYNAILFLNQIYLDNSGDDAELAAHLISVYFGLFSKETHGESGGAAHTKANKKRNKKPTNAAQTGAGMDRKLLSSLLVGVNRAFPYAKATSANFLEEINALFTVVHIAHHSTSVQALMLLFQVMNSTNSVSDRFYVALYDKLFDPKVRETSKHTLFLNLIFRAMKSDVSPARTCAMIKRLLQLTSVMSPAFTCAVLFLLSELFKIKPQLRTLLDQPEAGSNSRQEEEHFEDAKTSGEAAFMLEKEESSDEDDETEQETGASIEFDDGLTDAERSQKVLEKMFGKASVEDVKPQKSAGVRSFDDDEKSVNGVAGKEDTKEKTGYDPNKRNPLYSGAETSCAWEVYHLVHHYHPSVQMFARQLIENREVGIQYAGDPLVDFTLHAFFEKFMNKKPRHKGLMSGSGKAKNWAFVPINTEAVLEENEANLDESDKFFYKFFKERAKRSTTVSSKKKKQKIKSDDDRDADAFSDTDDEDDEMEAYAQKLAEGIMKEGDLDDEDPDMDDWSGSEDGSDDEEPDADFDDEGGDNGENDNDSDEDGNDDDDDDEDDVDGFDFDGMDDVDEGDEVLQQELDDFEAKKKTKTPPVAKRKSPFASADDYDEVVRKALEKQKQHTMKKIKKQKRQ